MKAVAKEARQKFEKYKDLLEAFRTGEFAYYEFAARVRRRSNGEHEDHDWPDENEGYDEL